MIGRIARIAQVSVCARARVLDCVCACVKTVCLSLSRPIPRAQTATVGNLAGDLGSETMFAAERERRCQARVQKHKVASTGFFFVVVAVVLLCFFTSPLLHLPSYTPLRSTDKPSLQQHLGRLGNNQSRWHSDVIKVMDDVTRPLNRSSSLLFQVADEVQMCFHTSLQSHKPTSPRWLLSQI